MFWKKKEEPKKKIKVLKNIDVGTALIRVTFKDGKVLDHRIYGEVYWDGTSTDISTKIYNILTNQYGLIEKRSIEDDTKSPTYCYIGYVKSLELISTCAYFENKEIVVDE